MLRGYAAKELLRLSEFEAAGPDGAPLRFEAGVDTVSLNRATIDVPKFLLPGPLPSAIHVRYVVHPGNREGDSHVGYTGRCHGYLGREFGLVSGRNVFLLPQPAERLRGIRVEFSLPEGWEAMTPWSAEAEGWRAGVGGKWAAEHLVTAAIGLRRFRAREFEVQGTRHRLAFESSLRPEAQEETARRLEQVARYVGDLFGGELGPLYLTLVAPRAPTGDEIAGEGWATGQGGTLAPATAGRLRAFAERLIEAYVRHAPYRTEIRRPEEFWLVDALEHLYSWLAVAQAGLLSEEEITRELAAGMMTTLGVEGLERDLERLYSASGSQKATREIVAPFMLALRDRELRTRTRGAATLDPLVRRMFRGRKAESLWSLLPGVGPGVWEGFRARCAPPTWPPTCATRGGPSCPPRACCAPTPCAWGSSGCSSRRAAARPRRSSRTTRRDSKSRTPCRRCAARLRHWRARPTSSSPWDG